MNGEEVRFQAPTPEYRTDSNTLRFWVNTPGDVTVGAIISASVLHYRFQGRLDGADAADVYAEYRADIDAAVVRRVAAGSREPVMLREHDLPQTPRPD